MRKKLLWAFGIGIAVIVVVVIGLSLAVKGYLKSDRLTAMILPKVEESTGRKARIERIDVSLFRGITVKGISLMERDGEKEFLKVKEFILEYSLLPLLEKKLVIRKVGLIAPSVSIIKEKDGRFNFSDILDRSSAGKKEAAPGTEQKGLPLSVEIDSISVRDGRMTFTEEKGDLPAIEVVSDVELKLSAAKGTAGPEVSGKIKIKDLTVKGEGDEIKGSGTVSIGADAVGFDITATVGKNAVKFSGDVRDYRKSPVARADINASELDIEKIMALSSGKEDARKSHPVRRAGPAQKERTKVKGDKEVALTASGEMKIGAAKYKGYILKDFAARYNFSGGNLTINPISAGLSGEKGMAMQGTAKGELKGSTTAMESAADSFKKTLAGKFSADLSRCEIGESRTGEAIALFTGIKDMARPKFDTVHFLFTIANEKVALNGTMTSSLMTLNPSGFVGFDKKMDVIAELRVAPGLAGKIVSGQIGRYVKDEKGWTVLPLRITGTTDKPSVGINPAAVGRQLQKGATQEIEKRLFKGIFGR